MNTQYINIKSIESFYELPHSKHILVSGISGIEISLKSLKNTRIWKEYFKF